MNPAIEYAAKNQFPYKESFGYWLMPEYYVKEDAEYTAYCTNAIAKQAIVMPETTNEERNPTFWDKIKTKIHEKGVHKVVAALIAITIIFFLVLGIVVIGVFLA